jgi:hypothetical protein
LSFEAWDLSISNRCEDGCWTEQKAAADMVEKYHQQARLESSRRNRLESARTTTAWTQATLAEALEKRCIALDD